MRILALFFLLILSHIDSFGQSPTLKKGLPMIDLTLIDGDRYTNRDVKSGPLVLIYFSPDCDHCQQFISSLLQRESLIKKRQVLLASFVEVDQLARFGIGLGINRYPDLKMGTEGESFRIARALGIRKFPYIALYDSARNLIRTFEGEQPFGVIVEAIEKM